MPRHKFKSPCHTILRPTYILRLKGLFDLAPTVSSYTLSEDSKKAKTQVLKADSPQGLLRVRQELSIKSFRPLTIPKGHWAAGCSAAMYNYS